MPRIFCSLVLDILDNDFAMACLTNCVVAIYKPILFSRKKKWQGAQRFVPARAHTPTHTHTYITEGEFDWLNFILTY